jgi:triphosphoribosyl-dephospho-CoA synthetase
MFKARKRKSEVNGFNLSFEAHGNISTALWQTLLKALFSKTGITVNLIENEN